MHTIPPNVHHALRYTYITQEFNHLRYTLHLPSTEIWNTAVVFQISYLGPFHCHSVLWEGWRHVAVKRAEHWGLDGQKLGSLSYIAPDTRLPLLGIVVKPRTSLCRLCLRVLSKWSSRFASRRLQWVHSLKLHCVRTVTTTTRLLVFTAVHWFIIPYAQNILNLKWTHSSRSSTAQGTLTNRIRAWPREWLYELWLYISWHLRVLSLPEGAWGIERWRQNGATTNRSRSIRGERNITGGGHRWRLVVSGYSCAVEMGCLVLLLAHRGRRGGSKKSVSETRHGGLLVKIRAVTIRRGLRGRSPKRLLVLLVELWLRVLLLQRWLLWLGLWMWLLLLLPGSRGTTRRITIRASIWPRWARLGRTYLLQWKTHAKQTSKIAWYWEPFLFIFTICQSLHSPILQQKLFEEKPFSQILRFCAHSGKFSLRKFGAWCLVVTQASNPWKFSLWKFYPSKFSATCIWYYNTGNS